MLLKKAGVVTLYISPKFFYIPAMPYLALLALLNTTIFAQLQGSFTDSRDGKVYKTAKIGKQTWMAENLNYDTTGSQCYNDSISYCDKYGRLYDWETAMKACPNGWHLPSYNEWTALIKFAGGEKKAGAKLKAASGWSDSGNGTDNYGFAALPGGFGNNRHFYWVGQQSSWWTATKCPVKSPEKRCSENSAYYWFIMSIGYTSDYAKKPYYLQSVRCLKD